MDCPDIDTLVYFESEEPVLTGGMVNVQVTSADGYDVFAKRI